VERGRIQFGGADAATSDEDEQFLKELLEALDSESDVSRLGPDAPASTLPGGSASGDGFLNFAMEDQAKAVLSPLRVRPLVIGFVDAIHGRGAEECGQFSLVLQLTAASMGHSASDYAAGSMGPGFLQKTCWALKS
jgi:hypothetical protein